MADGTTPQPSSGDGYTENTRSPVEWMRTRSFPKLSRLDGVTQVLRTGLQFFFYLIPRNCPYGQYTYGRVSGTQFVPQTDNQGKLH